MKRKIRVLSIDGGGIRGIIPAKIMIKIEELLQEYSQNPNTRISDYFDVSLDYLMRGIKKEENVENVAEKYKTKNMLLVWNDFLFNLSKKQKTLFTALYILIICSLVAVIVGVIYLGGYEIGKFIGYLTE